MHENARAITEALGGRWQGSHGMARCPAHEDRTPSLSVSEREGKLLVKCFAHCPQADVWDALTARGLIVRREGEDRPLRNHARPSQRRESRSEAACKLWREAHPGAGTPVELYLRNRGITIAPPPTLRYHAAVKYETSGMYLPCMVAAVCGLDRHVVAIQRTYLTFRGTKAGVAKPRMALGPIAGGCVRLAPAGERVWLTEGIEDALSVTQMTGEPAWAVLGTSGFRNIALPDHMRQVVLAPDRDDAGQAVTAEAARRLAGQGREVRIARLRHGKDWNEALDHFEERAAIAEHEGERERGDAEREALWEAVDG